MSLEAYVWAANLPLSACTGTAFRVLLMLADRTDPLGYGAWPSVRSMAEVLACSDRTVQRALKELVAQELIREGDQRSVDHIDSRYRPTVYDVCTAALKMLESRGDNSVTPEQFRGDTNGHSGVTSVVAHKPSLNPSTKTSQKHLKLVTARESEQPNERSAS